MNRAPIDEAFEQVAEFIDQLTDIEGQVLDPEHGINMEIEEATLGIPIQLELIVDEQGQVALGIAPPIYYVETSVIPVFHHIELSLERYNPEE